MFSLKFFIFFIFLFSSFYSYGWKLNSGNNILNVDEDRLTVQYVLSNYGSSEPVAVESTLNLLEYDGDKINQSVADDFVIIPSQVLILPNDEVSVLVTYIKDRDVYADRKYQVMFRQIEIPDDEVIEIKPGQRSATVKTLVHYGKNIFLISKNNSPLVNARCDFSKDNASVSLILRNEGTGLASLKNCKLILYQDDKLFKTHEFRALNLAVNQEVVLLINYPKEYFGKNLDYKFEYDLK